MWANDELKELTKILANRQYDDLYQWYICTPGFTEDKANWEITAGPARGMSGSDHYLARIVDNGVYFVQWNEPEAKITVTLLINEQTKKVYGSVVSPSELEFDVADIHKMNNS
jgi:hypothetical protein